MSSHSSSNNGLIVYDHSNIQFVSQSYPNDTVNAVNAVYHAPLQTSTGDVSPPTIPVYFSPLYVPSLPLHPFPNSQPPILPQSILHTANDAGSYNPSSTWNIPIDHPVAEPNAPLSTSATTTTPLTTSGAAPTVILTASISNRAKFPCPSCDKMYSSGPRAYTCLCYHIGAKPFACNGECGVVDW
jgi:hypothetical protein